MLIAYRAWTANDDESFFLNKEDARNALWDYYMDTYYENDDEELREDARRTFESESYIQDVGGVEQIEIYD